MVRNRRRAGQEPATLLLGGTKAGLGFLRADHLGRRPAAQHCLLRQSARAPSRHGAAIRPAAGYLPATALATGSGSGWPERAATSRQVSIRSRSFMPT